MVCMQNHINTMSSTNHKNPALYHKNTEVHTNVLIWSWPPRWSHPPPQAFRTLLLSATPKPPSPTSLPAFAVHCTNVPRSRASFECTSTKTNPHSTSLGSTQTIRCQIIAFIALPPNSKRRPNSLSRIIAYFTTSICSPHHRLTRSSAMVAVCLVPGTTYTFKICTISWTINSSVTHIRWLDNGLLPYNAISRIASYHFCNQTKSGKSTNTNHGICCQSLKSTRSLHIIYCKSTTTPMFAIYILRIVKYWYSIYNVFLTHLYSISIVLI